MDGFPCTLFISPCALSPALTWSLWTGCTLGRSRREIPPALSLSSEAGETGERADLRQVWPVSEEPEMQRITSTMERREALDSEGQGGRLSSPAAGFVPLLPPFSASRWVGKPPRAPLPQVQALLEQRRLPRAAPHVLVRPSLWGQDSEGCAPPSP